MCVCGGNSFCVYTSFSFQVIAVSIPHAYSSSFIVCQKSNSKSICFNLRSMAEHREVSLKSLKRCWFEQYLITLKCFYCLLPSRITCRAVLFYALWITLFHYTNLQTPSDRQADVTIESTLIFAIKQTNNCPFTDVWLETFALVSWQFVSIYWQKQPGRKHWKRFLWYTWWMSLYF